MKRVITIATIAMIMSGCSEDNSCLKAMIAEDEAQQAKAYYENLPTKETIKEVVKFKDRNITVIKEVVKFLPAPIIKYHEPIQEDCDTSCDVYKLVKFVVYIDNNKDSKYDEDDSNFRYANIQTKLNLSDSQDNIVAEVFTNRCDYVMLTVKVGEVYHFSHAEILDGEGREIVSSDEYLIDNRDTYYIRAVKN